MIWITTAVASLLATGAYAAPGSIGDASLAMSRTGLEARLVDVAMDTVERRQDTAVSFNSADWEAQTMAACTAALSQLSAATNPSGTAVCYNLPQLDTNTGKFMADLRLFQVSTPFGNFQDIAPKDVSGGVQYFGATAEVVSQTVNARGLSSKALAKRQTSSPTLLQTYVMKGQINKDQMVEPMTLGVIEPLVMPVVTLSAKNGAGQTVSTNVSSNEAAFVNGIFSSEVVLSDVARASLAVANVTAQLHNGTIAFVVPGVNILIFPVGLVVTGLWTVIGVCAYAFGTYERYGYREMYRRRKARDGKPASARI
ncbi:Uu.00g055770.m01.CDS01 [Anthostomella pinea]|uniref:Uu.00g055770.m01.CDS01 n=1 Tax=Anthostomella pinea TaxID=933095 RepID=A0AAI8VWU5_9PEZI|nr:Uu.00g055770.m01.CDS01 [Anthostomella pinea]